MKRPLGCISIYGLIASGLALAAVALFALLHGMVLFSPGPLAAAGPEGGPLQGYGSHAEMERDCMLCHRPWGGVDPQRCLACHQAVEDQIVSQAGLHGLLRDAEDCTRCHSEHQGRQAKMDGAARSAFPHDQTGFSLAYHVRLVDGSPFVCADCHVAPGYSFEQGTCVACHQEMDIGFMGQHVAAFGSACLSCHQGSENLAAFDHGSVFALQGAHAALACETCHSGQPLQDLSSGCVACHAEPDLHRGQFGTDCAACHAESGWSPARLRYHTFPLDHSGTGDLACSVCHGQDYVSYSCFGCHEHEPAQTERKHREEGLQDIADCARCHPSGEGENED